MGNARKLTGAVWGLLSRTRVVSRHGVCNAPAGSSQYQKQQFFGALEKQTSGLQFTRKASNTATTSIPLFQGSIGKAETAKLLVEKGVKAQKQVGYWLFGCSAWVFSMVIIGGVTRLTRSGLSMTDWNFLGGFPPTDSSKWEAEFEKYKASPEYKRVNKGMSIEDFKFIYWIEYGHRMWGRGLGVFFTGPFIYFLSKGYITRQLALRLGLLFGLGIGQGFVGWWMVKSGLEEPESPYRQPKVSAYRLASHLMAAFGIFSGLFWTALSVVRPESHYQGVDFVRGSAKLRKIAIPIAVLVGLTAASGAFVAGNDAGHAFNTFPLMGDTWIPDGLLELQPWSRNFFENTATVQLDHRILALTTLTSVVAMSLLARKLTLEPHIRRLINLTLGVSVLQVTLGISTLLLYVPVSLGAAHQAGALSLFASVVALLHALRKPSPAALRTLVKPL
ncbi:hypothetical protein KP509_36G062600 [Ceratopteris richardii]|uniref:Cytochrome c oxidase assembly protein COX15 n=1 Tax=Ceratopteris richardii TaxID=49495 RepID=A0A8T2QC94_CERRI|nr:hypothetical protein KP509_36G062600 [Ceratopteris richardii]